MRFKEIVSERHEMLIKFTSSPEKNAGGMDNWVKGPNGIDAIFKCV